MYRFLKTQNLSYSMIRTCLKDHSLVGLLDKSRSSQFIFLMQMRSVRPYSRGKKGHQQSSLLDIEEKTDKQNLYEDMMQLLNVGAKAEEEQLARLREKKSELKEMVQLEVETTGIPAIIRAMVPSLFLNKYHSFSGVLYYPTPVDWYCEVEHPYQTSEAYDRLCLKLEVPYHLVSGFSGRQALFKLCEVTKPGNSIFSFCEDSQAIDELFEVFAQRVNNLEKKDLMKLIHYSYILKDFSVKCYKKIFSRFMVSMDNQKYSISELLDFLDVLKQVDQSIFVNGQISRFERLTGSIWNYISNRPQSISCSLLRRLYCDAPTNHERIFSVLDKVLIDNLHRLEVCDVFVILKEIQSRKDNLETGAIVSIWLEKNLNTVTISDLETLLPSFLESRYINPLLFEVLSKVMLSRNFMKIVSTELLTQILTYCTLARHYDQTILKAVCNHYIEDKEGYKSEQLHSLLQTIGTLNFVPDRQREFFTKVELHLRENFYNIDILMLLEMFVHLIYIDKVAVNFSEYIFAPLFLGIVTEMKIEDRLKATRCIRILEMVFTIRKFLPQTTLPVDEEMDWRIGDKGTHAVILPVFTRILGDPSHIQEKHRPTGSGCYLEMQYNVLAEKAGMAARFHDNDKIAFLVMTRDSFCNNKKHHMLGEEMTNIRLLQELGLTVVWVHSDKIEELDKENKLDSFVKSLFVQLLENAEENLAGSASVAENAEPFSGEGDEVYTEDEIEDF